VTDPEGFWVPPNPEDAGLSKKVSARRVYYGPAAGTAWNPLRDYPRNAPCFCAETPVRKFKKCCEPLLAPTIPHKEVARAREFVQAATELHKRGGLK
jgi:hypothetical protein